MKTIYKVLMQGFEEVQVSDNFETVIPYTEIAPLELEDTQSQVFDFSKNEWKELVNQNFTDELLAMKDKMARQELELINTQLAVAEVFELISGGAQ